MVNCPLCAFSYGRGRSTQPTVQLGDKGKAAGGAVPPWMSSPFGGSEWMQPLSTGGGIPPTGAHPARRSRAGTCPPTQFSTTVRDS